MLLLQQRVRRLCELLARYVSNALSRLAIGPVVYVGWWGEVVEFCVCKDGLGHVFCEVLFVFEVPV